MVQATVPVTFATFVDGVMRAWNSTDLPVVVTEWAVLTVTVVAIDPSDPAAKAGAPMANDPAMSVAAKPEHRRRFFTRRSPIP